MSTNTIEVSRIQARWEDENILKEFLIQRGALILLLIVAYIFKNKLSSLSI